MCKLNAIAAFNAHWYSVNQLRLIVVFYLNLIVCSRLSRPNSICIEHFETNKLHCPPSNTVVNNCFPRHIESLVVIKQLLILFSMQKRCGQMGKHFWYVFNYHLTLISPRPLLAKAYTIKNFDLNFYVNGFILIDCLECNCFTKNL